ncbi:MAG TPA: hypothetical protein VJ717_00460 [Gemmatimonadaceae bacterium]|nr:hypothetical protein [Gemmatimonadaceae bacterium]
MIRSTMLVVVAAALVATAPAEAQKRQRDRISREEILESAHRTYDLYQVVRSLRPRFLEPPPGVRSFGNSSAASTPVAVYVDGKRDIGIEALKLIDPQRVEEVRYFDPERANAEFGQIAANGAIVVKLARGTVRAAGAPVKADSTRPPR